MADVNQEHTTPDSLVVDRLTICAGGRRIVDGVSFAVPRSELVGLVGESGSGKSTIGFACLGLLRSGVRREEGRVLLGQLDVLALEPDAVRTLRREKIAYVPQSAGYALNPSMRIGRQLADRLSADLPKDERARRIAAALRDVALPDDPRFLMRWPHELSGGQQQRVAIAQALLADPELVVFDEPTTGLDVQIQHQILQLIARLCAERRMSGIFISHDLAAVAEICERMVILRDGKVVEEGSTAEILAGASHAYTRELLASVPSLARTVAAKAAAQTASAGDTGKADTVLAVRDMSIYYRSHRAVGPLSLEFARGRTTAIVGESGSGKTSLCRAIIGLHSHYDGAVALDGERLAPRARARPIPQRRRMQYVFQNPWEALNPRWTVNRILRQPAEVLGLETSPGYIREQLEAVRLPAAYAQRLPDQLSGGERQRVALARALGLKPDVLICDEVTSALDVSVQATVVKLIAELQRELGLTVLFVTHHLALVSELANDVVVLRQGMIDCHGPVTDVFATPPTEYTARLIELSPGLESFGYRAPLQES